MLAGARVILVLAMATLLPILLPICLALRIMPRRA